jgi:isopentenyldiphosphate isomerase
MSEKEDRFRVKVDDETWAILQKYAKELGITEDEVALVSILSFAKEVAPDTYKKLRAETDPKIVELVEREPDVFKKEA